MSIMQSNSIVTSPKLQTGATLIEVLAAALILGVGMLGILSLQTRSLQLNQQSYMSAQATILAQDMAERIVANRSQFDGYQFDSSTNNSDSTDDENEADRCKASPCTPEQLVAWDTGVWSKAIKDALPGGFGEVVKKEDYLVIRVHYLLDREGEAGSSDSLHYVQLVVAP